MFKAKPCKFCHATTHSSFACFQRPAKPLRVGRRMQQIGKQGKRYKDFRDTVAYPYLVATFGERCAICGKPGTNLDVDHKLKRGSHPELKYELSNLQLLCRPCHDRKDN